MRKRWSKVLSLALAVSMGTGGISTTGFAANYTGSVQTVKEEKVNKWKTATKPVKKDKAAKFVEGEVIVMYENNNNKTGKTKALQLTRDMAIVSTCDFDGAGDGGMRASAIRGQGKGFHISLVKSDKYTTRQLMQKLQKQDNVLYVEPNYVCKAQATGDYSKYLWALNNTGQNAGTEGLDLNVDKAGTPVSDKEKVIAIVDSGLNYEHEDLAAVAWNNPYTADLKGVHGYDFINEDADPMDDNGHGSHCAGIIAGDDTNSIGIKGVAGDNVKIMGLKFLDYDGYGDTYDAISAYNYIYRAQKLGVNVVAVNNSWGGYGDYGDDILEAVMNEVGKQGALSICAASNDSSDNDEVYMAPTNFDSPYIISVAASNENGELAEFSNFGKTTVDLAAPGANILSTVAEDTFNPSIYEDTAALCGYYKNFTEEFVGTEISMEQLDDDGKISVNDTFADGKFYYTVANDGEAKVSVIQDKENYFGMKEGDATSLKWEIKGAKSGEKYSFIVPYPAEASKEEIYQSFMFREDAPELGDDWFASYMEVMDVKVTSGGVIQSSGKDDVYVGDIGVYGKENYWTHLSYKLRDKISRNGVYALMFTLYIEKDGDYGLSFDDLATSKANVQSKEFGKYDFYNGTSMATPYVTGAVALAKGLYPEESALETRARILGSVSKQEKLKEKVVSEGILDLAKISNPNMVLSGAGIQADGIVTVGLVNAKETLKVTVNGEEKPILQRQKDCITFQGVYNKKMDVEISDGNDVVKTQLFFLSGEENEKIGVVDNLYEYGSVVSNGDKLQFVGSDGMVINYNVAEEESYNPLQINPVTGEADVELPSLIPGTIYSVFDAEKLFGDETKYVGEYTMYASGNAVSHGKQLITAVRMELGYAEENVLAVFNEKDIIWEKVTDIPKVFQDAEGMMLASYGEKIYVMGGYQCENNKAIADVYSYDCAKDLWTKEASMPEGRFNGKAVATNGKLVVTLGGNENGACATNYVFDGTNWIKGGVLDCLMDKKEYSYIVPYEEGMESSDTLTVIDFQEIAIRLVPYYDAVVDSVDQGLIYAGIRAEGMGNTFIYNVNTHSLETNGAKVTTYAQDDFLMGGVIGDKLYLMSGSETMDDYENEGDWALSRVADYVKKNVQEEMDDDFGFGTGASDLIFISSLDVKNQTVDIVQKKVYDGGYVQGVGKYNVGELATFQAVPHLDYFVKQLFVNGEEVQNGYSVIVTEDMQNMKVSATFGEYVSGLFLPLELEVTEGEQSILTPEIYPMTAENQNIIWSSDDESIATVDENGVVTGKKAGETVTIKAVAADRKTVSAICTVTVVKKVLPAKIKLSASKKTLKVGESLKIKAKVTPNGATNKEVKWTSSNKKYATVNANGKVTAKKAGKGKTVKITATCVANKKVKASIKIKIKK